MNNRPHQLDGMVTSMQDKLYAREPQLMHRLVLLFNRIENLKLVTEPFKKNSGLVRSKNHNQSLDKIERVKMKSPKLRKFRKKNLENRRIRNFNSLNIKKLKTKKPVNKKISALPRDVLWMVK